MSRAWHFVVLFLSAQWQCSWQQNMYKQSLQMQKQHQRQPNQQHQRQPQQQQRRQRQQRQPNQQQAEQHQQQQQQQHQPNQQQPQQQQQHQQQHQPQHQLHKQQQERHQKHHQQTKQQQQHHFKQTHIMHQQERRSKYNAFWPIDARKQTFSKVYKPMVNYIRRRARRDALTPFLDSSGYVTSLPSEYVTHRREDKTPIIIETNEFITGAGKVDERSSTSDSTRSSNMFTTADVASDVHSTTMTKDGFDEVVSPINSSVNMLNSNIEGNFTVDYSRPTVAGLSISSKVNDEGDTLLKDNLSTTSATTKEADVPLSNYMAYRLGKVLNLYAQPIIAVVGVAGNTLSMLVMFQPNNRRTSFGVYIGALAMSDTMVLVSSTAYWLTRLLYSTPLRDIECKFRGWTINSLQMNGFFIILGLTFDRLIAVRFPLKAVIWCTTTRAKIVCGTIFAIVWLLNIPFFVFNHAKSGLVCGMGTSRSVISLVYPWIAVGIGFVVPLVSLVSMNAVIITAIISRRRFRAKYDTQERIHTTDAIEMSESATNSSLDPVQHDWLKSAKHQHKSMTSRDCNAIVTLLLVSFTFLLLVSPHYVHIALFQISDLKSSPSLRAYYSLFFQVSKNLFFLNNACNFFLYCLSGTKFRNDVARLFHRNTSAGRERVSDMI